jgi:hypothetical protein
MAKYLLLLRGDGHGLDNLSPEEIQNLISRYQAWSEKLRTTGKYVASDKLRDHQGKVLRKESSKVVVMDGPYTETKEILGGYFAIEAGSYDEAIEITRDCPHFDFGSIEIREIEDMRRP